MSVGSIDQHSVPQAEPRQQLRCKLMGKGLDTIQQELFDYTVRDSPLLDGAQVEW